MHDRTPKAKTIKQINARRMVDEVTNYMSVILRNDFYAIQQYYLQTT